jgi:D-beta-D-heptose 7-phosphate kinase/D-beta-D-heptose 1-phosphate adenosyltransferase
LELGLWSLETNCAEPAKARTRPLKSLPRFSNPVNDRRLRFQEKIIPLETLPAWRARLRTAGKKLVVTNGCFDLLHVGHVTYLEMARSQGDALLVGLNSDSSVQKLKGAGRPLNPENDRAAVLAALQAVDGVCIFPDLRATGFLALAQPDIYVKGGDYTLQTIDQDERRAVESAGGTIIFIPFVPGKSTAAIEEFCGCKEWSSLFSVNMPRQSPGPNTKLKVAQISGSKPKPERWWPSGAEVWGLGRTLL